MVTLLVKLLLRLPKLVLTCLGKLNLLTLKEPSESYPSKPFTPLVKKFNSILLTNSKADQTTSTTTLLERPPSRNWNRCGSMPRTNNSLINVEMKKLNNSSNSGVRRVVVSKLKSNVVKSILTSLPTLLKRVGSYAKTGSLRISTLTMTQLY